MGRAAESSPLLAAVEQRLAGAGVSGELLAGVAAIALKAAGDAGLS